MKFQKFAAYITGIQAALLVSIYFDIPLIRQILGFFYLALIPGLVLLFCLRLDKRNTVLVSLLYTTGLSLAFLMFSGIIINYALPVIGIEKPLTTYPIFFSISILILVLLFCSRRKDMALPFNIKITLEMRMHIPITIFLVSLPILSVAGTILLNNTGNNVLLILLLVLIIIFSISTVFLRNTIPAWVYPVAIFTIGISLLFMHSLNTPHLVGYDIHGEYHVFRLTDLNSLWSPYLEEGVYRNNIYAYITCISITILPVIFHVITGISPEYIFKLIFVSFFSIIPLAVFRIARYNFDKYTSFLSALFFIILGYFHTQLPMVPRQGIAFIFFSLLILALFDNKISHLKRRVLFVVFVFSAIMAHYSTAIVMFIVLTAFFILNAPGIKSRPDSSDRIRGNTIILIGISLFAWQVYTEGVLLNLLNLMKNFFLHLSEFLEPETKGTTVLSLIGMQAGDPVVRMGFYIGTLTRIFIVVGTLFVFLRWRDLKIKRDFVLLQLIGLAILFLVVITPYVSKGYNAERVYLQTLIFLAPSFVIGGLKVIDMLRVKGKEIGYGIVVLILVFHFAFQAGLIYQFVGIQQSVALAREGEMYNRLYVHEQDIESAKWLGNIAREKPIFTDANGQDILTSYGMLPNARIWAVKKDMELFGNPYIYLRYSNVVNGKITLRGSVDSNLSDTNIPYMLGLDITDKVFDNGGSMVYRMRFQPFLETAGI